MSILKIIKNFIKKINNKLSFIKVFINKKKKRLLNFK